MAIRKPRVRFFTPTDDMSLVDAVVALVRLYCFADVDVSSVRGFANVAAHHIEKSGVYETNLEINGHRERIEISRVGTRLKWRTYGVEPKV